MSNVMHATKLTKAWIEGEHNYAFGKSDGLFPNLETRLKAIMETEIPDKWFRQQLFRDGGAESQANQSLMKVAAAAKAAVLFTDMIDGATFKNANQHTDEALEHITDSIVRNRNAYARPMRQDFETELNTIYTYDNRQWVTRPTFCKTVSIAVANLCDMYEQTGSMELPAPGFPSGELQPWTPDLA